MGTSNIADKVVVITGASSGIGESAAKLLARHGARVVLGARRMDRIDAVVKEISAAGGWNDLFEGRRSRLSNPFNFLRSLWFFVALKVS